MTTRKEDVKLTIAHRGECPSHRVRMDPDPDDWFCDDDEKVVCLKAGDRTITCANRPYQTTRELQRIGVPEWCPLREGK